MDERRKVETETLVRVANEMAELSFTQAEIEVLAPQIQALLHLISSLDEIDLAEVEPALTFSTAMGVVEDE